MTTTTHFIHNKAEQKQRTEEKRKKILEFLSNETFSTSEIIGELLELSRTATYRTLKSMEKEDLLKLHEIEYELAQKGKQTIWGLTPTGALLAADIEDFNVDFFEVSRIATSTMAHSIATQRVKVSALKHGWSEWVSSRKLKQMAVKDRKTWKQIPDAVAVKEGKKIAFEIERTVKTPKRYEAILANYAEMFLEGTVAGVIYICSENLVRRLEILFSKIEKITIQGKIHPVHENVRKRMKFMTLEEWKKNE